MNKNKIILLLSMIGLTILFVGPLKTFADTCTASYFTCHNGTMTCFTWSCTDGEAGTYCTNGGMESPPFSLVPPEPPAAANPSQLILGIIMDPCPPNPSISISCGYNFATLGGTSRSLSLFTGSPDAEVSQGHYDFSKLTKLLTTIVIPISRLIYTDTDVQPRESYLYICRKDLTLAEIQAQIDKERTQYEKDCAKRPPNNPCDPYVAPFYTSVEDYYAFIYNDPVVIYSNAGPYWVADVELAMPNVQGHSGQPTYYCPFSECTYNCENRQLGDPIAGPQLFYPCGYKVDIGWTDTSVSPLTMATRLFRVNDHGIKNFVGIDYSVDGVDVVENYNILRSTTLNGTYITVGSVSGDKRSFSDVVTATGTYYYKIEKLSFNDKTGKGYKSISPASSVIVTNEVDCDPGEVITAQSLNCSVIMYPQYNPNTVNVNTNTTWIVNPTYDGYVRTWKIDKNDGNGFIVESSQADVLNKIFTTIGIKTVSVHLASTTNTDASGDCQNTATTTVVQEGGGVQEI